jgi:hypothetical protein
MKTRTWYYATRESVYNLSGHDLLSVLEITHSQPTYNPGWRFLTFRANDSLTGLRESVERGLAIHWASVEREVLAVAESLDELNRMMGESWRTDETP